MDRSYMVGTALLVAPPLQVYQREITVYLPTGRWFDYHTWLEVAEGSLVVSVNDDYIPVYIRGGVIIPRQDQARRSSGLMYADPYTLIIALDSSFEASGYLYSDDCHTNAYQSNSFLYSLLTFKDFTLKYKVLHEGHIRSTIERVVILGLPNEPKQVALSGVKNSQVSFYAYTSGAILVKLPFANLKSDWSFSLKY